MNEERRRQIAGISWWIWLALALSIVVATLTGTTREIIGFEQGTILENALLKAELPHDTDELRAILRSHDARWWRVGELWLLATIPVYIFLFYLLSLPPEDSRHWTWESPVLFATLAGLFDCAKILLLVFVDIGSFVDPKQPAWFTALRFCGALKWLFLFLACRALAIQYLQHPRYVGAGVVLRAFAIAGAWAAVMALLGLPSRPMTTFCLLNIIVVLGLAVLRSLLPYDRPNQLSLPMDKGRPIVPGTAQQDETPASATLTSIKLGARRAL